MTETHFITLVITVNLLSNDVHHIYLLHLGTWQFLVSVLQPGRDTVPGNDYIYDETTHEHSNTESECFMAITKGYCKM